MRSHLIFNLFLSLVVTSQSSIGIARMPNTASTGTPETRLGQPLDNSLEADVSLRTPTDSTITFRSESEIQQDVPHTTTQIPHLVLKRNGVRTPGFERTLQMSVNHLSIPKDGLFVDLKLESQHDDPDLPRGETGKIEIWHEVRFVPYSSDSVQSADFKITFNQTVRPERTTIQTPTDYYVYHLSLINAQGEKLQEIHEEYAFLLEN